MKNDETRDHEKIVIYQVMIFPQKTVDLRKDPPKLAEMKYLMRHHPNLIVLKPQNSIMA
jgi:hypothetical protein